jgi:FtsZ-interacting cell division protein ZipA
LSQDQLDAFCRALYQFAAEEGGAVTCPDKEEALALARELDLFCMDVDVLIGLNVVSADSRPFTSEAMHSLAQEARLSLESDGSFHARDEFGHSLFTLANQEDDPFPRDGRGLTTHGVTLLFDVPRVSDGLAVFDRMTRLGFDLAWRLEGRLVDDNGRTVNEESLNRDRARLAQFYARMEAKDIPAGGERALRLFV